MALARLIDIVVWLNSIPKLGVILSGGARLLRAGVECAPESKDPYSIRPPSPLLKLGSLHCTPFPHVGTLFCTMYIRRTPRFDQSVSLAYCATSFLATFSERAAASSAFFVSFLVV